MMLKPSRWGAFVAVLLAGTIWAASTLSAQEPGWQLTGGASHAWFGGGATDTTGSGLSFGPTPSVAWSLGADHPVGRVRLGLQLSCYSASLQISGAGVRIVSEETRLGLVQLAALVSVPLLRIGRAGAGLTLAAGPTVDLWSITDTDGRTRGGAIAALLLGAPIAPRWTLLAAAAGTLSGSPFNASELPVEFEPSTLLGGRVGLGVRYGD
jgi:hypothetical protein